MEGAVVVEKDAGISSVAAAGDNHNSNSATAAKSKTKKHEKIVKTTVRNCINAWLKSPHVGPGAPFLSKRTKIGPSGVSVDSASGKLLTTANPSLVKHAYKLFQEDRLKALAIHGVVSY
ncbi:unnamed protein product, partial [Amoebophrya sp. A120]|eukprot:GSA120T00016958001.1